MSSINYDLSKLRAIAFDVDGVLSPSTIPLSSYGEPLRMVNIKDGYAIQLAIKYGYKIAIITGADTEAIKIRFKGLGVEDIFMKASVKLPLFEQWMQKHGLKKEEVAFVGDDIPDMEVMQRAGLSVAPADAAIDVKNIAGYISPVAGGYGVARDLIEQIMRAQNRWLSDKHAFGW